MKLGILFLMFAMLFTGPQAIAERKVQTIPKDRKVARSTEKAAQKKLDKDFSAFRAPKLKAQDLTTVHAIDSFVNQYGTHEETITRAPATAERWTRGIEIPARED